MAREIGPVWVFVEQCGGNVLPVSYELVGKGRELADELGTSLEAVLLGDSVTGLAGELFRGGVDRLYVGDDVLLKYYQPEMYVPMIVDLARERKPEIFLVGSTACGKELAPLVAARLKTGISAHCIDLALDGNRLLEQIIPAYGGLISIVCPEMRPQMATIAKGVFALPGPAGRHGTGELVELAVPQAEPMKTELLEVVYEEAAGLTLDSAATIVAGGAGAKDAAGWRMVEVLADELGAALGATRPPVDEGWIELDRMIGQSGKMVTPDFYIGVGLSGELQHMVGIVGAKLMVAINNDPKAPVFDQVDYGLVDDCQEFLPVLIAKIRQFKQGKTAA
ncbi:MAG: electron transfer flavoprotein subunit alpha/FixB family protein [Deltaproteobacteria bacterium]|nr:electron transfer flavoprotein subunit alpha/FixB family protein [Candidatus Anaeroferrophillacea bacterium]